MAVKKLRTPIIKPRAQGGTFYTFASALEDVGLNINELKNKVALSHYVLLNIPSFSGSSTYHEDGNVGDFTFAEHLQNYALNMETILRNQESYNFSASRTVSERVFWKFMQKYFGMSFTKETDSDYYVDNSNIIQGFGQISAGAQRTDAYGIYNETYIQVPSSYGKMKVLFEPIHDTNYYIHEGSSGYKSANLDGLIENISADEVNTDGTLHNGITANAEYDQTSPNLYTVKTEKDELCAVFSLAELRRYYEDDALTYDTLGINSDVNQFEFNAILVYYSVYDSTGVNTLATNAYGIMILDSATNDTDGKYVFPSILKKKTTAVSAGNSYAFRLNIKTSSVYAGDVVVEDESTGGYVMGTEFNDMLRNLSAAVETLRSNASVIANITTDNQIIKRLAINSLDKLSDIEKDIQNIKNGRARNITANVIDATTVQAKSLLAGTEIYDSEGNAIGKIGEDGLVYTYANINRIDSSVMDADNIYAGTILAKDDGVSITDEGGATNYATIDDTGITSNGGLFVKNIAENNSGSEIANAVDFIKEIDVRMDASGHISLTFPDKTSTSDPTLLAALAGKTTVNTSNLLFLLLDVVKSLLPTE